MMICDDCRYSKQALITDGNGRKSVLLAGCYLEEIPIFYSETGGYECEYFTEESGKIQSTLPDKETCNPKICRWCKYSSNGKRDPARSITMCDGCRYNEEFEHI